MKIGIFDSGVGGLIIGKAIHEHLPQYDYLYFGDTEHMPYGEKTPKEILEYTIKGIKYLFENDCLLIIIACNTASAQALRKIQQKFLPKYFPDRKVLGVIIPAVEDLNNKKNVGVLATRATVKSKSFTIEIKKRFPKIKVFEQTAPKLARLIEDNDMENANKMVKKYGN